ncbi:subtilisin family serine protease [Actinocorallia herbida]|uniref:Subtilisin family serine protease n=1 Tax=Actinocorallia herbida TaxID=58109 RepID=A0A3N1CYI0_9ACTN|nr:S8 family serine peptidase [Actinocorallia herbida]ROO86341.1 subtilisin family serine protease [Actinocorallia herbida]
MLISLAASVAALTLLAPAPVLAAAPVDDDLRASFEKARRSSRGKGVTVAVLGSGVARDLPALGDRVLPGKSFVKPHGRPVHGTLMASMIHSLAPEAKILPVQITCDGGAPLDVTHCGGVGTPSDGLRWAAEKGADVIVVSRAWRGIDSGREISYALSKGAVVVAPNVRLRPSGGSLPGRREPVVPARDPGVVGVAVVDAQGRPDRDSALTSASLVAAPGHRRAATGPDGRTWTFWGEGPAVSLVAAAAALVRSEHPDAGPAEVAAALAASARHPKGGYDPSVGFGLIDPAAALRAVPERTSTETEAGLDPASFPAGEPPVIAAVGHRPVAFAVPAGALGGGLVLLGAAAVLGRRGRTRPEAPAVEPAP